ncbi:MAG: hypothetical protein LUH15_20280 [Tannerellaceae bacterium]|nr:hypothetical protein [Tannerellaceae bacterium]
MKKQFLEILTAGDEHAIRPFLRQLNEKEKKALSRLSKKRANGFTIL